MIKDRYLHDRLVLSLLVYVAGYDRTKVNGTRIAGLCAQEAHALIPYLTEMDSGARLNNAGIGARRRLLGTLCHGNLPEEDMEDPRRVPSPRAVARRLSDIGGHANATRLKLRLTEEGWSYKNSEYGIQLAIDDGAITINEDLGLSVS